MREQTGTSQPTMVTNKNAPVSDSEAAEMAEWLEAQEGKKDNVVASPMTVPSGVFFPVVNLLDLSVLICVFSGIICAVELQL